MKTSLLAQGFIAFTLSSLFGCGVTMTDLQALNRQAATLQVHCHPSIVPDDVRLMALQSDTNDIVTDEREHELLSAAPVARVFIEFNDDAPPENARIMASQYGLSCPNMPDDRPAESESLRGKPPCPSEVTQSNAQPNPNSLAAPGQPDCDPSTTNSGTKPLPRIAVCAQPPGITSTEWYGGVGIKANVKDQAAYDAQVAKATVVFYLDPNAPPESVWNFGPNTKVRCKGKKEPLPFEQYAAQQSNGSSATNPEPATPKPVPAPTVTPKNGDGKTSDTSSPTGSGPPLSTFERFARNLALGAAIANMDTSGNAKDPNGNRHGMVNGTNVGGWSFPPLQAGLSTIQIITSVGLSPKTFVEKIAAATKRGQRVIINAADNAALQMADELVKQAGQVEVAKGLQEISAVLPFNMGQKFTKGLESKFQAHKIFEKQAFEHFGVGKFGDDAIAKAPSVILTDAEHQAITKELNKFWRDVAQKRKLVKNYKASQKELRALYERVYKDHPHWLQAIEHLLRQVP